MDQEELTRKVNRVVQMLHEFIRDMETLDHILRMSKNGVVQTSKLVELVADIKIIRGTADLPDADPVAKQIEEKRI